MPLNAGLRIARVHSPFLKTNGSYTIASLVAASPASKQWQTISRVSPPRRASSTASQAKEAPKSISEVVSSEHLTSPLPASTILNPPASTRPPPLDLPTRDPSSSVFRYFYNLGKAYTTFYKTGVRAIFTNRKLLAQSPTASVPRPPISSATTTLTRSDVLLRRRVRHDLACLPTFGVLLLVCGELTPLVVLLFPRLTPLTCRIPKQADALRRGSEARRAASFRGLRYRPAPVRGDDPAASGHICRALGLTYSLWDKVGIDSPFSAALARRAVDQIAADDAMIRAGGGVEGIVDEEVVLACEERGIDVLGKPVDELRSQLADWLRKTAPEGAASEKSGDTSSGESARKEAAEKIRDALVSLDGRA
ncbi:uncharacterized protein F4812DRAFT_470247 [Daldinia caldariorum]|uniref:uncharacterized protein n=1 Tax=Daldinia caldariorum TaxID=326644 RepID=UPI002008B296|nr:uncharacterized protein F4812DRAFT_470247 [Daldinia caldariorum]KAI1469143.1 hypothetical protein F4812DRAFT_470247 [Daldinia caldariorum]